MVYLNAFDKSNKQAALLKSIDISIPSNYINENMQLFKGEEQPDGNINWTDPQPLNSFSNTPCLEKGKAIFEGHCQSCHTIFKDWTGPALAGVEERVKDRRIIKEYIRFPAKMIYSNSYFMCLKKEFGSVMTAFPMLTDQDIDCLLDYVKNETAKRPDLKPAGPSKPIVPCIDAPLRV
jgi:cytochrome c2